MWALPDVIQMWSVFAIVTIGVYLYVRERFSIEAISVGLIFTLMLFGVLSQRQTKAWIAP